MAESTTIILFDSCSCCLQASLPSISYYHNCSSGPWYCRSASFRGSWFVPRNVSVRHPFTLWLWQRHLNELISGQTPLSGGIYLLSGTGSSVWPLLPACLEPAKKLWPFGLSILGNAVKAKAFLQAFIFSLFSFFFFTTMIPSAELILGWVLSKQNQPSLPQAVPVWCRWSDVGRKRNKVFATNTWWSLQQAPALCLWMLLSPNLTYF